MAAAWYFTLVNPDLGRMQSCVRKASEIAHKVFSTDLEIIDIIYIPAANCYFYHDKLSLAAETIEAAIILCEKYPEILPYIDKRAHLLNCLLDIYMELQNLEKCREIAAEIDRINESYVGQGIHRSVSPEIRKAIM
jgi:tetratricopeptide (TPR) repeat protein